MSRAPTTSDVYNAIAEPRRREILDLLRSGEHAVGDLVDRMQVGQSTVSEHLRVLREVELVRMRKDGRRRLYSVNAPALIPVSRWVERFEQLWGAQLDRVQARAETRTRGNQSRSQGGDIP